MLKWLLFLYWISFAPLSKTSGLYFCGSISGLCYIPLIYLSLFPPVSCCFDYYTFRVVLKSGNISLLNLFSFSIMLAILCFFAFLCELRLILLIPTNNLLEFWLRLHQTYDRVGENWHLNYNEPFYVWTLNISPFI